MNGVRGTSTRSAESERAEPVVPALTFVAKPTDGCCAMQANRSGGPERILGLRVRLLLVI